MKWTDLVLYGLCIASIIVCIVTYAKLSDVHEYYQKQVDDMKKICNPEKNNDIIHINISDLINESGPYENQNTS